MIGRVSIRLETALSSWGKLPEAGDRYTKAITLVEKSNDPFGWPYQGMARLLLDEKPEAALDFAKKAVTACNPMNIPTT